MENQLKYNGNWRLKISNIVSLIAVYCNQKSSMWRVSAWRAVMSRVGGN